MLNGPIIIGIILWLYLLSVLNRANLIGFHFWVGSVGLFAIMAFISRAYFVWFLSACITQVTGWWGTLTGLYSSSCLLYTSPSPRDTR